MLRSDTCLPTPYHPKGLPETWGSTGESGVLALVGRRSPASECRPDQDIQEFCGGEATAGLITFYSGRDWILCKLQPGLSRPVPTSTLIPKLSRHVFVG